MGKKTLGQLLEEDSLGSRLAELEQLAIEVSGRYAPEREQYKNVVDVVVALKEDEGRLAEARKLDQETPGGREAFAELLGVTLEDYEGYRKVIDKIVAEMTLPEIEIFKGQWHELLGASVIDELDESRPSEDAMPCVVFYSADWCAPCWAMKPTLLELSQYFPGRLLFFSDDKVHTKADVPFVPIIVAYFPPDEEFPEGKIVTSECGSTTEEFWKNLNLLITLGSGFQEGPRGKLVCTDEKCGIEPVKE